MKRHLIILLFAQSFLWANNQQKLENNFKEQNVNLKGAQESQRKVSNIAEETRNLAAQYRATLQKIENTKIYNQQLRDLIASQTEEMESIKKEIISIKQTDKDVGPLMARMLDTLDQFVQLDAPFLPQERKERIANLQDMMKRADVTKSEKYRRILEAYQVENDYGKTIEAYRGALEQNGEELTVDYLRIGRVVFIYQTLDGKKAGFWNQKQRQWQELSSDYNKSISTGLKIARKQMAPDLLRMPVTAPTTL